MSDSDRGRVHQIGLKRWVWPVIVFAVAVLAYGIVVERTHYHNAARNAASYARDAHNQTAAECRVPVTYPSCAREIEQARRANQRDEYDLYAQKVMALWTAIMGAMAVVGIALSGVGVYLIWHTWDATQEAANSSRKTLRAYIAKERAILKIRLADWVVDDRLSSPNCFVARLRNLGESLAQVHEVHWEYLADPVWPKRLRFTRYAATVVAAREEAISEILSSDKEQIGGTWLAVSVRYSTLQEGPYWSHGGFIVTHHPPDGYGPESWSAQATLLADMPSDT